MIIRALKPVFYGLNDEKKNGVGALLVFVNKF